MNCTNIYIKNCLAITIQPTEKTVHLFSQCIDKNTNKLTWQKTEQVHTEEPAWFPEEMIHHRLVCNTNTAHSLSGKTGLPEIEQGKQRQTNEQNRTKYKTASCA